MVSKIKFEAYKIQLFFSKGHLIGCVILCSYNAFTFRGFPTPTMCNYKPFNNRRSWRSKTVLILNFQFAIQAMTFDEQTIFNHLNTQLVRYSDPHCIQVSGIWILTVILFVLQKWIWYRWMCHLRVSGMQRLPSIHSLQIRSQRGVDWSKSFPSKGIFSMLISSKLFSSFLIY